MNQSRRMALAAAVLSVVASAGGDKPKPAGGWETDYAHARQIARQTGKPMFVVFR